MSQLTDADVSGQCYVMKHHLRVVEPWMFEFPVIAAKQLDGQAPVVRK